MRLWSICPKYLDSKGLVALWREGLLAQNVLLGKTKGYKNHPQLDRFKNTATPVGAIASYLRHVAVEADSRGYNFNKSKIVDQQLQNTIDVTSGQLEYEYRHLLNKLKQRDPEKYNIVSKIKEIEIHPVFSKINGDIETWEIIN